MWEEWMNDVDDRQLLQDMLDQVPESGSALAEIEAVDERFLAATLEPRSASGEREMQLTSVGRPRDWWYWRLPPTPYLN